MSTQDHVSIGSLSDITIDASLKHGFMLDDVLVLPTKCEIVKHHTHHHLSRKAMDVLVILSCSSGRVLSREVIAEYVWGSKAKKKANITALITEIRRLLDDHAENPAFIQTIPRVGYRLITPAIPLDESLLPTELLLAVAQESEDSKSSIFGDLNLWRKSRLVKVAGTYIVMAWVLMQVVSVSIPVLDLPQWFDKIALLVLVIGFPVVLWYNWAIEHRVRKRFRNSHAMSLTQTSRTRRAYREISYICVCSLVSLLITVVLIEQVFEAMDESQLATDRDAIRAELFSNAIAVMPFTYSGASNNANSVDIFQSEILNFLSQSPTIKVISERVLSSIPEEASLDSIRELTGAKYILEGNISEDGADIQISTTIVDSETGYQLWTNRTRTESTNKLAQLETISKQVKNALTFLMPQTENAALKFTPTDDIKAYDFYVRAKTAFKAAFNVEQLKVAEGLFLQALSQDSKFEQAQIGLCQTYIEKYALSNASQSFNLAKQACEVSSDTNSLKVDAQIALGRLHVSSGEYSQALTFFDNALASEPENSMGLTGKARALSRLDRPDAATELFLAAIKAEPGYWRNYEQYGIFLFNRGQYPRASLQFYKQSLLQPNSEEAFNNLGAAHYLNNDYQSAIDSWRLAAAIKPSANTFSNLGTSMFFAKQFDNAIIMYQQAVKRAPSDFLLHGNLADAMKYANNRQQDSIIAYQTALDLAIESDVINPNNATTKASIARYMSELNRCSQAQEIVQALEYEGVNDPYIHYDLALIANNCGSQANVVAYLSEALNQGYPGNLLLDDHQFAKYHTQIKRILDTL